MPTETLLAPMGAVAALTFLVLTLIPIARFRAAFAGRVAADDFKLGESQRVPARTSLPNRNLMNLLEMPVLFYVLCLICLVTHRIDSTVVTGAWLYVGLRAVHNLIHMTNNNVFHRLTAYAASNVLLSLMWAYVFWSTRGHRAPSPRFSRNPPRDAASRATARAAGGGCCEGSSRER